MNPGRALPAILNNHPRCRLASRGHRPKFSERPFGKPNLPLSLQLLQHVAEGNVGIGILVRRAYFCDRFPAIGDEQSLSFSDGEQVTSKTVLEFTTAHSLHVATSTTIVATKEGDRN